MKYFFLLVLLVGIYQVQGQVDIEDTLVFKQDTVYKKNSNTLYTGNYRLYYPGDLKVFGTYLNGLKEGEFQYFNQGFYNFDLYHGRILDSTVTFKAGKRSGLKRTYDSFSTIPVLLAAENYINDRLNGESNYWDRSGQLESTVIYEKGVVKKRTTYTVDTAIAIIEYRIKSFPNDTLDYKKYVLNSPLEIEVIAWSYSNTIFSLNARRYKVISFNINQIDQWRGYQSNTFSFSGPPGFYGGNKFWITDLKITGPQGKEYPLPNRTIYITGIK